MQLVKPTVPAREFFVEIGSVKRIRDGITYAQKFGWPTRIVSDAGYGKTTVLYYLAQDLDGTYCNVGFAHKKTPDMYRMILSALGCPSDKNYSRDLFNDLIWRLKPSEWALAHDQKPRKLLIVDEAQNLDPLALRDLLNIQETCNIALIISGNGSRISTTKVDRVAWEQIDSRVGMEISLPPLNRTDCNLIGSAYGLEGMDAYEAIANYGTRTTARLLTRLLDNARPLANAGGAIRLQHVRAVLEGNPKLGSPKLLLPEAA